MLRTLKDSYTFYAKHFVYVENYEDGGTENI
jgi:hypothetical protein